MPTIEKTIYNFGAGPATLPKVVVEEAAANLANFSGSGLSLLELGHRGKEYAAVHEEAKNNIKKLLGLSEACDVLFVQGGASEQFAWVPLNFLSAGKTGNYVHTGSWAKKAISEAKKVGATHLAADTSKDRPCRIPSDSAIQLTSDAAYLHITSNETIEGTQWKTFPSLSVPLIADMSSDILSRPLATDQFSLIYAGAQKNLGPAGVTLVIVKKDFVQNPPENLPTIMRYKTHLENDSLYNTPPCFAIYVVCLVTRWLLNLGGLSAIEKINQDKAALLYSAIDNIPFYQGIADRSSRSLMNVTFKLPTPDLDEKFVAEAKKAGLIGLKGHRSVGSIRASIYNAMPKEGVQALVTFMQDFARQNG